MLTPLPVKSNGYSYFYEINIWLFLAELDKLVSPATSVLFNFYSSTACSKPSRPG